MIDRTARFTLLVALAAALAGCGDDINRGGSGTTGGGTTGPEYQLCVDLINQYRATVGRAALTRWTDAESCSSGEAQSDSQSGTAHGAFGTCGESAQDECPGWSGDHSTVITGCLDMMWAEGPGGGHYDNMSNASYTVVACGFFDASDGVWSVQNFR